MSRRKLASLALGCPTSLSNLLKSGCTMDIHAGQMDPTSV